MTLSIFTVCSFRALIVDPAGLTPLLLVVVIVLVISSPPVISDVDEVRRIFDMQSENSLGNCLLESKFFMASCSYLKYYQR